MSHFERIPPMLFQSIHPTEVNEEDAENLFLVLADRWTSIPADELARAFVRCSLYHNKLPASFRANIEHSNTYGLLLDGLDGETEAFETRVADQRGLRFSMAAATSSAGLVPVWSKFNHYGNAPMVHLESIARAYRERVGQDHKDTLKRARAAKD